MIMLAADQARFPKATNYIKTALPKVVDVPSIRLAMQNIGQLNKARLTQALRWGNIPSIEIVPALGACGKFKYDSGSNTLRIEERLFTEFEAGRGTAPSAAGRVYVLGVTLLHELVHWGDDQDGIDRAGEEGEEFERQVYGGVIPC